MSLQWRMRFASAGIVLVLGAIAFNLYNSSYAVWTGSAGAVGVLLVAGSLLYGRNLRELLRSRSLYYGTSSTILTIAVIAIVVLVNVIASNHHIRWDLTANKLFSLSDQTKSILANLDEEVTLHAFVQEGDATGSQLIDLLKEYTYLSDKVKLDIVDPDKRPSVAREYEVRSYNTIVVEAGGQRRTVNSFDFFTYTGAGRQVSFKGEQAVTRAILGVTRGEQGTVYFTTGHGERDITSEFSQVRSYIKGEGYTVKTLNLAEEGQIPEDTAILVIAGPTRDFVPKEAEVVRKYLEQGGRAFILLDPILHSDGLRQLKQLMADWGITINDDFVLDPKRNYFMDALSPIPEYTYHAVTRDLMNQNLGIVLPRTRSLSVKEETKGKVTSILSTSDGAWGETSLTLQKVKKDENDIPGPLTVAVAVEREMTDSTNGELATDKEASSEGKEGSSVEDTEDGNEGEKEDRPVTRLVVVGSSSFATNDTITFQGNVDFFINTVNWLAGSEEMLSIRPKTQEFRRVVLSGAEANVIFYTTVFLIPGLFLIGAGAAVWRRRNL